MSGQVKKLRRSRSTKRIQYDAAATKPLAGTIGADLLRESERKSKLANDIATVNQVLLRAEGLRREAGGKTIVRSASFSLRAGEVVAITGPKTKIPSATRVIRVPCEMPEIYSPIPYIVPGQIFAALLAEFKGLDPDKPRSLHIVTRTV